MEDGRPARPAVAELVLEADMKKASTQIGLGIALGAGIGAATGVFAGHIAIWLAAGIAIGVAIGSSLRGTSCAECETVHKTHEVES
jgi:uncharacterized membrane protein YfcA